tara:strand:+ start:12152 stop:12823 length:672 start_codon:yes stop_codon:yes gene_type:complete
MSGGAYASLLISFFRGENILATNEQYDAMGQPIGTLTGEPDPDAVKKIEAINEEQSKLKPLVDIAPELQAPVPTAPAAINKEALIAALKDPDIVRQVVHTASQSPDLRKMLDLESAAVPPSGDYTRNYSAEPALRVHGGVEVAHQKGFEPLPPSYIPKFVAADGVTTCPDPEKALKGPDGRPVKTEHYKHWLDLKSQGKKMDTNVRYGIMADSFTVGDEGMVN